MSQSRIVFETTALRIVRVVLPESRREPRTGDAPADTGVRYLIEVPDGMDLMDGQRWKLLDGPKSAVSDLVRVVTSLKTHLLHAITQGESDAENQ